MFLSPPLSAAFMGEFARDPLPVPCGCGFGRERTGEAKAAGTTLCSLPVSEGVRRLEGGRRLSV
jgi:hypothetical protein